jgi:hypothetical protein
MHSDMQVCYMAGLVRNVMLIKIREYAAYGMRSGMHLLAVECMTLDTQRNHARLVISYICLVVYL